MPVTNYTFQRDNTFTAVDNSKNNTSGTYSISGSALYVTDIDGTKDTSTFQVTSTELTMTDVDQYTYLGAEYETTYSVKFTRK